MAASNALSQYYVHSCSVTTHEYNVFEFCCFLSVINYDNRAFGEGVKSFQYFEFVFIGCTKSSAIRYYNICVYCEYKNVIRMKDLYTPMKSNNS